MTRPKPRQVVAGADRRVEREQAGQRIGVGDVARRAVQRRAEARRLGIGAVVVEPVHRHPAVAAVHRHLHRFGQPAALGGADAQPVLHHQRASTTSRPRSPRARAPGRNPARAGAARPSASLKLAGTCTGKLNTVAGVAGAGAPAIAGRRRRRPCRGVPAARSGGSAAWTCARTAASGGRSPRSSCRPSSARCAPDWSGRSRSPAARPRCGPPAACPSGPGTGARRPRRSRRSAAVLRRRACRTPATTCPIRTRRSPPPVRWSACRGRGSSDCSGARLECGSCAGCPVFIVCGRGFAEGER